MRFSFPDWMNRGVSPLFNYDMNATGYLIRRYRKAAGMDLEDLAFRSGIPADRLDRMENRLEQVFDVDLVAIAEALDRSVVDFIEPKPY